jgi:DNA-3-methyladenine glycosylase I
MSLDLEKPRCTWTGDDPLYIAYHDEEWGRPVHDDRRWFEKLVLEGMQAGLSWITILRKRENFREAFDNFDPKIVAVYDEGKIEALMQDAGIIRNRSKIKAAVSNARAFLEIQAEFGSFDAYIWKFIGGEPRINHWPTLADVPAETEESREMSKALKKRGFKFVGPTICYALMQSCGMVNDHTLDCFLHPENSI